MTEVLTKDLDTHTVVITGTHSAGKSTLLSGLEDGKLSDLGVLHPEYDDFGFGVQQDSHSGIEIPVITVPESARWLAVDVHNRPDLLAENYQLDFQLSIDAETIFRFHAGNELAATAIKNMQREGLLMGASSHMQPLVVSDRGPLDGVVYSELRCDGDTNKINGFSRTGFATEWLKSFIDLVVISDHSSIPFEFDGARMEDHKLRNDIAECIDANYRTVMPEESVTTLHGDEQDRKHSLLKEVSRSISGKTNYSKPSLPFQAWGTVKLQLSSEN
jgi:hypothetical protein